MLILRKIKSLFNRIAKSLLKSRKKILILFGAACFSVILVQIIWPVDRLLPFSYIGNNSASFANKEKARSIIADKLGEQKIMISTINNAKIEVSGKTLKDLTRITAESLDAAFEYPLAWRFLPFSFLSFRASDDEFILDFGDNLNQFAYEKSADLTKEAENAIFLVDGGNISIKPSANGQKVEPDQVKKSLKNLKISLSDYTEIEVKGELISAGITTEDYNKAKAQAEKAVGKSIYFMVPIGNKIEKFATTAEERAKLLGVKKAEDGSQILVIKDDELAKMFGILEEKAKKNPGITVIKTINGNEVGRTNGLPGKGLDFEEFRAQLNVQLFSNNTGLQIDLRLKDIAPSVRYEREFTKTNKGLQAYLEEIAKDKKIKISVQQLSGEHWSASVGGDDKMVSASTYKLFIAQYVMNKIDNGQLNWSSSSLDTNVEACFKNMIVRSANNCSENWINTYGRNNLNNYFIDSGYDSVFSNSGAAASTTSNCLIKMLTNLYYGDNFSAGNANKLRDLMLTQIYRQGIPAGTESKVANKVGFLGNVLNDAAIVYHPKGSYVVAIMTEGENWGKIAEITQGIEKVMYEN